jgi:hypothetical protein
MTAVVNRDLFGNYFVSSPSEASEVPYADMTQRIVNRLPWHSKIRKQKHSVGQHLLNAIAGDPLQIFEDLLDTALREKFTALFPLDTLDVVKRVTVPEWVDLSDPTVRTNYVANSSFEIWTNQATAPDSWHMFGRVEVDADAAVEGHHCLSIHATNNVLNGVDQTFAVRLLANTTCTASVWYNINAPVATIYAATTNFGLRVTAYYADNTQTVAEGLFLATNALWRRLVVPISLTKEVSSVRVELVVKNALPTFNFSGSRVAVDCVQFELGSKTTPWRPDILDELPYTNNTRLLAAFLAGADTAHFVDNLEDFWDASVPTRTSYVGSSAGTFAATSTAGAVEVTDDFKNTWKFQFQIFQTTKIRKIGTDVPGDYYTPYTIKARRLGDVFDFIQSPEIEALTFFGGYLWAVIKEDTGFGTRARFLHVLDIRTQHPEPTFLRSIAVIAVPSGVPMAAALIRAEFKFEDRQHIFLSTATTQYQVRLHYDLFTLDPEARTIYLREDVSTVVPV